MTSPNNYIVVVNIANCPDFGTNEGDYYIGRQFLYNGKLFRKSKYANPYKIARGMTRQHVLEQYVDYLYAEGLAYGVQEDLTKVKRLGCWCKPLPCHGDILASIAAHGPAWYKAMRAARSE